MNVVSDLDRAVTLLALAVEDFKKNGFSISSYHEIFRHGGALLGLCTRLRDTSEQQVIADTDISHYGEQGERGRVTMENRQPVGRPKTEKLCISLEKRKQQGRTIHRDRRKERVLAAKLSPVSAHYLVEYDSGQNCYFMKITPDIGPTKWFRVAAYKKNRIGSWLSIPRVSWKDLHREGIKGKTELCPYFIADYLKPFGTVVDISKWRLQKGANNSK